MPQMIQGAPKSQWFRHISKGVALIASTGAAFVSIVTALFSYGVLGTSESHQSIGNFGAAWVRVRPAMDTATAIGDTIHFAATIADKNGSILVGARPTWTTGDSTVATVGPDGSVIARGPGLTTVSVVVGTLVSNARVYVKQTVAGVAVSNPAGDTAAVVGEGAQLQLRARALDARGHTVAGRTAQWHIDDTTVATLGPAGAVTAQNAGRSVVSARIDGATGYLPFAVVTTATNLSVVAGSNQRALAGRPLPQRVVVRATNRKGAPAAGKLVTFRLRSAQGKLDPATALTDADGRARTQWTMGDDPGAQMMFANVEGVDTTAVVEAEAEPVARNTHVVALAGQLRSQAGVQLTDSVGVRITDSTGRALPGVPVRWTALDGAADVIDARTDSMGVVRARWTLSSRTGTQRLRALVGAADSRIAPVTIAVTAMAGAVADIVVVSGDRQRVVAGKVLPQPVVLRVVDASGNGAADIPVVLSLSSGTVADTALVTDSLGYAKTRWTMGRSAGDHALAAHVDGLKKLLKVSARATPAAAANLSFDDAPPSPTSASNTTRPRTKRLYALVTDIYGNPVAEAPVTLSVKSGAVTPARAVTDSKGRVTLSWMMGASTSEQTLRGTVRGTDVNGAYVTQVVQAGSPSAKPGATKILPAKTKKTSP